MGARLYGQRRQKKGWGGGWIDVATEVPKSEVLVLCVGNDCVAYPERGGRLRSRRLEENMVLDISVGGAPSGGGYQRVIYPTGTF